MDFFQWKLVSYFLNFCKFAGKVSSSMPICAESAISEISYESFVCEVYVYTMFIPYLYNVYSMFIQCLFHVYTMQCFGLFQKVM